MKIIGFDTVLIFLLFISFLCPAQKEFNKWYFGYGAALDFNTDPPTPLTSAMSQFEGCASVADRITGDLLFYTNGVTVWNSDNLTMTNGSGLIGGNSSSQSALIVPMPCNDSLYYLFTIDEIENAFSGSGSNGVNYSVINMNLEGGKGAVTSVKNVHLMDDAVEHLTATLHANGLDVWVISKDFGNDTNEIHAWLLTSNGITDTVISPVDVNIGGAGVSSGTGVDHVLGQMKVSPDHTQIACPFYNQTLPQGQLAIFNFNNTTGAVDFNSMVLENPDQINDFAIYGVEFSPDNSKLYVAANDGVGTSGALFQYDLSSGVQATIESSKVLIASHSILDSPSTLAVSSLQVQRNGKIYCARSAQVGVIHSPNSSGTSCNYVYNYVQTMSTGGNAAGLPNVIVNALPPTITISVLPNSSICNGENISIVASGADEYVWNPLPASISNTGNTIYLSPSASITYTVTGTANCVSSDALIYVTVDDYCGNEQVEIPNVFTPNGDNNNDAFSISGFFNTFSCVIFNRWGNEIYRWESPSGTWDGITNAGTPATDGVYFYTFEGMGANGNNVYHENGTVTLIR